MLSKVTKLHLSCDILPHNVIEHGGFRNKGGDDIFPLLLLLLVLLQSKVGFTFVMLMVSMMRMVTMVVMVRLVSVRSL